MKFRSALAYSLIPLMFAPVCAAAASETSATDSQPRRVMVTVIAEPIIIDGVLDETIWTSAPKIGDLIQREPNPGAAPSERTDVTLLRDADNLYIGVRAHDSAPEAVIGTQMARDGSIRSDDRLEILLDTFRDQRNAFYFATNPAGALVDGLAFGNDELNTEWDAIWDLRTQRTDEGWTAEIAIPFKSLSFPAGETEWGFNLARHVHRKQEENRWSGARLETDFLQVAESGVIANLAGIDQGVGLDLRPFVAGSWLHSGDTGDDAFDLEPGLDVFYNITPSLKLTGTINTDFGETEVDARQINLTRFSLFFPEKRAFFLEDAGVFAFASTGPDTPGGIPSAGADVYPFFSRRIGLLGGQEVPLDVGVKLTGKAGETDVGFLGVRTGGTSFVEAKDFVVGRVKQNLFEQSYLGGIFTYGNPSPDQSGQTYGLDLRLATSRFLGESRNLVFNAYALRSDNEGVSGDDWSYGFSARYPNDMWDAQIALREVQRNFDPGVGFIQRGNIRMFRVAASYNPRPRDFLNIQQMFHDVFYTRIERLDTGRLESSELYITPLDWHFRSGDSLHAILDYARGYERLFAPFEIAPGIVLAPGEYRTNRFKSAIATASKRRLSGSIRVSWGDFWSGSAEEISASLTFKVPPWFTMEVDANQTFAHLPEGDFTARIFTTSANFAVSPRLSFSNLIQYDNRSNNLGWQSRVRWTLKPGSDLFVSLHQGWIREENGSLRFRAQDTRLSAKLQYTVRF